MFSELTLAFARHVNVAHDRTAFPVRSSTGVSSSRGLIGVRLSCGQSFVWSPTRTTLGMLIMANVADLVAHHIQPTRQPHVISRVSFGVSDVCSVTCSQFVVPSQQSDHRISEYRSQKKSIDVHTSFHPNQDLPTLQGKTRRAMLHKRSGTAKYDALVCIECRKADKNHKKWVEEALTRRTVKEERRLGREENQVNFLFPQLFKTVHESPSIFR